MDAVEQNLPHLPDGETLQVVGPLLPAFSRDSAQLLAAFIEGQWDWTHSNTPNWHAVNNRFSGAYFEDPDGSWELNGLAYYTTGQSQPYSLQFSAPSNSLVWFAREGFRHGFSNVTTTNPEVRVIRPQLGQLSVIVRRRFAFQNTFFVLEAGSYIKVSAG